MNIIDATFIATVLAGTLRAATPVIFASLGELINERGGVLNLGLEGIMLVGACTAVAVQTLWGEWAVSLVVACAAAGFVGAFHAAFCVFLRTNQIVTGLAVVFLCQGLTAVLGVPLVGAPISVNPPKPFAWLSDFPILGHVLAEQDLLVFIALAFAPAIGIGLKRTRWGILLRACGESASSARAAGVSVWRIRMLAGLCCGILCGLGGAHLALFYAQQWQENMVSGRGWIALVMVIFSRWRPGWVLVGAYLFGGLSTLQLNLQSRGVDLSQYLLAMAPFVATIVMFSLASRRIGQQQNMMPRDLAKPLPVAD